MKKELDYRGKWALITGTTSGIGEQFSHLLAEKGLNLVLVSKSREKAN
jgi:short-subunit dehydrogenase